MKKPTYLQLEEWIESKGYHVNTLYIMMDEEAEDSGRQIRWDEPVADWILKKWNLG